MAASGEDSCGVRTREAIVGWRRSDSFEIFRKQNGADVVMDGAEGRRAGEASRMTSRVLFLFELTFIDHLLRARHHSST